MKTASIHVILSHTRRSKMNENISAYVDYNRAFLTIKEMYEKAILELEICNNALRGIAKELGIMNPILL